MNACDPALSCFPKKIVFVLWKVGCHFAGIHCHCAAPERGFLFWYRTRFGAFFLG